MPKHGAMRFVVVAVAVGLLIFLAAEIPMPAALQTPFDPIGRLWGVLWRAGRAAGDSLGRSGLAGDKVLELAERELTAALARIALLETENEALRRALGLRPERGAALLPAPVIGFLREGRDEYLMLGAGASQGLAEGAPVLDGSGVLAGAITSTSQRLAKVRLLTSPSSAIEVEILPRPGGGAAANRPPVKALARGANSRELEIQLVPPGSQISPGDLLVTRPRTASGRIGRLAVGEIREVRTGEEQLFTPIRALHLFDPLSADTVFVAPGDVPR